MGLPFASLCLCSPAMPRSVTDYAVGVPFREAAEVSLRPPEQLSFAPYCESFLFDPKSTTPVWMDGGKAKPSMERFLNQFH
ncbi:hypothetical protein L209DRAFT_748651 [Thermothelomyces heterothallicus CBS 203.75]